ncbi:sigma-70 family RNA polymerase sigma factor [candidate division KSB3 bacterium]|uniref:Sigma-70 family RNA polymerase sigma factor n=1 Tax=candidate division KSB3 bacterium TaxID=2044937 RepID=A0A9D5K055_9BACT|nr:sigma-70 family RNA polymerase sigma factor [candidate division KSB3 bacterium]MBD3327512.1 sigma-70 family RNA polymerase sigma factor [candidate division KSB3 bacterium]
MAYKASHTVSHDTLSAYLKAIGKIPVTTREEEVTLAERIQHGDSEAIKRLVEGNLRFVVKVAQGYQGCGMSLPDLINEGNIGPLEAATRFDASKGVKFISYGVWWIRQAIMQALAEQSGAVRLPLKQAGLLYKLGQSYSELLQRNDGKEPTPEELAKHLNVSQKEIENILRVSRSYLSLDAPLSDGDDSTFIDLMEAKQYPPVDQSLVNQSIDELLDEMLSEVSKREEVVLRLRYGLSFNQPFSSQEIAEYLNIPEKDVIDRERRALKLINTKMKTEEREVLKQLYGIEQSAPVPLETVAETLGLKEREIRKLELNARQELEKLLKPREEIIIRLRYGIDYNASMTLEEVGMRLGLTRERIRQIEDKAKKRLRYHAQQRRLSDYLN